MLYTITHLRGRLHITLRDLRSALAFMLVGRRDCDSVHDLYRTGGLETLRQILDGFYFNAWMGGAQGSGDRLLALLQEIDIGEVSNPALDRLFDFHQPNIQEMRQFRLAERNTYDDALFTKVFETLPRTYTTGTDPAGMHRHRDYVAMLRRRYYFERRDEGWPEMLPYRSAGHFLSLVAGTETDMLSETRKLLLAINRGEGLTAPSCLGHALALRVRQVEHGTVRSYRLFDGNAFTLVRPEAAETLRCIEYLPQSLLLQYTSSTGHQAMLTITLDGYEMLTRLNDGYHPSVEELQGLYRSLAVFKNVLASAPYQEVLITETGQEFYRIRREVTGALSLAHVQHEEEP
jgi:hypothetical protein